MSAPHPAPPRTAGRLLSRLLLATVVGVASLAGVSINHLTERADHARQLESTLAGLVGHAHELNGLEWETLHRGQVTEEVAAEVAEARGEMSRLFGVIGAAKSSGAPMDEVIAQYLIYQSAVDREFDLLGAGEILEAVRWDEEQVDPAFDRFSEALDEGRGRVEATAELSLRRLKILTFAVVFAAMTVIGLLFLGYHARRRAGDLAAAEHETLRRANLELEDRVRERTAELAAIHARASISARQAGMAEVANNVLHNVGNALNSVNVGTSLLLETLARTCQGDLSAVAGIVREHADHLGTFVREDEQGRQIPAFLQSLADQWRSEHAVLTREALVVDRHIQHVREIISRQQAFSGESGVIEDVPIDEAVHDALMMNRQLIERNAIEVDRDIPPGSSVLADRSKLTQILVNLVCNAAQALAETGTLTVPRRLTVRVEPPVAGRTAIHVSDNGPGIPPENLTRIFSHGFTTKPTGHGFGLHGSALAAREMGGALRAQDTGAGRGATFTVELPAPELGERRRTA